MTKRKIDLIDSVLDNFTTEQRPEIDSDLAWQALDALEFLYPGYEDSNIPICPDRPCSGETKCT